MTLRLFTGVLLLSSQAIAEPSPAPFCSGEYADDLSALQPAARELERHPYSFCVRTSAVYECLSYAADGSVRRQKKRATAHGTAFAYRQQGGDTFLVTNDHVAEWPTVTDDSHKVEGVPPGCKRVSDALRLVDSESDDYDLDDIKLERVVTDRELDAAVLKARAALPVLPWKVGRSAALRERNVVEVRGFPLGVFRATNVGKVISAYDHDDYKEWDHDDFVIDALLSQGNSGSPVLAVSCKTGELELGARRQLLEAARGSPAPFFPLGALTAEVRVRADNALVFEVYPREFPRRTTPMVAFEDLPFAGGFGQVGRIWFGGDAGLRGYRMSELDAEAQATLTHLVEALRRDALAFFDWRKRTRDAPKSRADFDRLARLERTLDRTAETRRDLTQAAADAADRLGPRHGDAHLARAGEILQAPPQKPVLADRERPKVAPPPPRRR